MCAADVRCTPRPDRQKAAEDAARLAVAEKRRAEAEAAEARAAKKREEDELAVLKASRDDWIHEDEARALQQQVKTLRVQRDHAVDSAFGSFLADAVEDIAKRGWIPQVTQDRAVAFGQWLARLVRVSRAGALPEAPNPGAPFDAADETACLSQTSARGSDRGGIGG